MTRAEWQQIAEERLHASQSLLMAHNWHSAYYLSGYAVECGLKSCIVARLATEPELIFIEKRYSEKCWTHDIDELVRLAGLDAIRNAEVRTNTALGSNWLIVRNWNEGSRYQMKTQTEAQDLFNAIADGANGVMQWIRPRW